MSRPEPLALRAAVVAVLAAALHLAIALGYLDFDPDAEKAATGVIDVVAGLVIVLWTRPKITPLASPRTADGRPLIPAPIHPAELVDEKPRRRRPRRVADDGYGLVEVLVAVVLVILIVWLLTRLF